MSDKTRAEVWADMVETTAPGAAKELRRLSASEAALLEALEMLLRYTKACEGVLNCTPAGQVTMAEGLITQTKEARNG